MRARWLAWLLIVLAGWTAPAWAAATLVQHRLYAGTSSEGSHGLSYVGNVTSGSLLIMACAVWQDVSNVTAPVLADTLGNPYGLAVNQGVPGVARVYIGYANSPSGGANSVTCDPPGNAFITMVIAEYAGMATASPLDQVASACGAAVAAVSTGSTANTVQGAELVFGAMTYDGANTTITESAPCALIDEIEPTLGTQPINVCALSVAATGPQSASWVTGAARDWGAGVATFKALTTARRGYVVTLE